MGYNVTIGKISHYEKEEDIEYPVFLSYQVEVGVDGRLLGNHTSFMYLVADEILGPLQIDPKNAGSGYPELILLTEEVIKNIENGTRIYLGKPLETYTPVPNSKGEAVLHIYQMVQEVRNLPGDKYIYIT